MNGLVLEKDLLEGVMDGSLYGCTMTFPVLHRGRTALIDPENDSIVGFTYLDGIECLPFGEQQLYGYTFGRAIRLKEPVSIDHPEGIWAEVPDVTHLPRMRQDASA